MEGSGGLQPKNTKALLKAFRTRKMLKEDNIPCQIEEGLFLGCVTAANNKDVLKSLNVTHILTVANSLGSPHPSDFTYKKIDVTDKADTDLAQHFSECFDFIDEAKTKGGSVLVHCFQGKSRSVTIVVAYLMKKRGMTRCQALEHVRLRRSLVAPNFGFMQQLQTFEESMKGTPRP